MSQIKLYLLLPFLLLTVSLSAQTVCGEEEPFLLPPTSTFCADSSGWVTIDFKVFNNGDPGTYKVQFPDGSDTIYTNVVNVANIVKTFRFDCGKPPGKPTPPRPGSLFFEYQGALTIIRQDCVDERGDNQQGSYDFRVVPNPIIDIKTSDLRCIEEPFNVSFEAEVCSDILIEAYQWYMDDSLLVGETTKKLGPIPFGEPGEHVARVEVTTFKGCDKYFYEKVFTIRPTPKIELNYIIDTAELCNPNLQVVVQNEYDFATSWLWTTNSDDVTFSDPTDPNPIINIGNNQAGVRQIVVNASNPFCSGVADTFYITTLRGQTIEVLENLVTCTGYEFDLCANLQYLPTPDNIRWTADKPGVGISDSFATCPKLTFPAPGNYVMTANGNDVCGESFEIPINVRVRDGTELEIDISEIDTICTTEDPINLYDYISRPGNVRSIRGAGVADGVFNPFLVEGNVDITVTDSCGAVYPIAFEVIPQERYIGEDYIICEGDSVDLFSVQEGDYTGTGVTDNIFRSEGLTTGVYKVRFNSRTFCGGLDSLTIIVQEFPEAAFEIATESCIPDSPEPSQVYAGLEPIVVENRSSARVICYEILETGVKECNRDRARFTFREPGTYTLQQVVAFPNGQCTDTTTQEIEVLFPPTIEFTAVMDSSTCDSLNIAFDAGPQSDDVTYNWRFTSTDASKLAAPVIDLLRPLSPEVLGTELAVTNACYTTEDTFGVVLPLRFRVSFDILNDNNTVCSDDTIWLSNTSVNADSYRVTYPDGRQATQLPPFLVLRNTTDDILRYPISLEGTNRSCPNETMVDTVYILPIETQAEFGLNYEDVCSRAEVTLDNSSTPGALTFVHWGDGSSPQFIGDLESLTHFYDVERDTTYRIMMTARLCGLDTTYREITVRKAPDAAFTVFAEAANCIDETMWFTPRAAADDSYGIEWEFGDGSVSQDFVANHKFAQAGNYMVYCRATSENGCVTVDSSLVNIGEYDGAEMDFSMAASTCTQMPFDMELRAPVTGWYIDYGNGIASPSPVEAPYFEQGNFTMRLTATSANGCTIDSSRTVRVYDGFTATIQTTTLDTFVELGDELDLSVHVSPPRNIRNVRWAGDSIVNPQSAYTRAQPIDDGFYTVALTDEHGCRALDSMRVRVVKDYEERIFAPNAFSPNEDGFNDRFNLDVKQNTVVGISSMRIVSRFGSLVYECTDCPTGSVNVGWDGTLGGKPLESNVYIWAAEVDFVDGTSQLFTGDVTLLR